MSNEQTVVVSRSLVRSSAFDAFMLCLFMAVYAFSDFSSGHNISGTISAIASVLNFMNLLSRMDILSKSKSDG